MKGSSAPSFPSSTAPPPVTAGAPGTTASVHRAPSPPMNNHPLPFDQTGQTPHFHHAFHSDPNTPSDGGMGGPALNNKRRSIADSLFVPTKSVKVKEKRNSGSASSISSVESYRQDEGINSEHHSLAGWTSHPKSASSTSTSSDGSASVLPAQRMSLEPQQASPSARRPSTAKASGRAAGGSAPSPKTFQCTGYPGCNMVFTRSEHLARHERKHTGEKPYKCIVANCPRTFSRYDNMIQHTQTHGDRTKRDSLAAAAAAGNASRARSSSLHSNPFLTGRPRGGSSPVVFGSGYDDLNYRSLQNSPASSYIAHSSAFSQQQRHPYSPHYQQLQQYSHQQQHQNQQHPVHLKFPDGTPAMSSHPSMASRTNGSIDSIGNIYGGDSQSYPPESGPSTPVIRTLKANSRSLPHLQPRSSSIVTADSPSMGLQQSMSGMEIEEFKRRKSEVLFPLSFSEDRVAAGSAYGHAQGLGQGQGQGIGLGMSSPLTPAASHTQPLPHVEKLSPQEQERLIEHRRSAQAILCRTGPGAGLRGQRGTYESFSEQGPLAGAQEGVNSGPESIGIGPPPPHVQHLSTLKKERLLEHRKSTPELMYDAMKAKRSSNDPTDMNVLPLPSRDSRSGVQWFSQINTPSIPSFPLPLTSRDAHGGGPAAISSGRRRVVTLGSSAAHSGEGAADISSPTILPPILGTYDERHDDRLTRPRALSGHIHPLAHHDRVGSSGFVWQPLSNDEGSNTKDRSQFDPTLSPRMERYLEERYYPIQKREVLDAIERMDVREFLGLKAQVAGSYASEQFRNPEFLGNMAALLCIIRAPHPFWKSARPKRSSGGSIESGSEGAAGISRRQSYKDMGVDNVEPMDVDEQGTMMDVKKDGSRANGRSAALEQPCRFALDIDMDSFGRDPEPELRSIEGLTINSLFPTKSFVAGFEPAMMMDHRKESNAEEDEGLPRSVQGYPSNARIGRFYLPERAFRTPESLQFQPDPSGPWVCCRFEEYLGVSIWVLGSVLEKYRELAQRYKMALTLMGEEETLEMQNRAATFDHDDEWEIRTGEQYDVKVKESTLYPEMVQQVWKDMYQQYHHQHQQQQYQQHQPPHRPSSQLLSQQQQAAVPPHMTNRVATYEEYQKSRWQAADSRRESYPALLPSSSAAAHHYDDHYYQGEYHPQSQYQQQHRLPQNAHQSYINHCEDLSSGPSSPNSVHQDDCFQEDVQSNDSAASTPRQHYRHHQNQDQNQNHPYHYQEGSSNPSASGSSGDANMHRRISIAELCNPMQSLATARERDY
ncbi:hypothetical protein BC939DRAFT_442441 [Gamsiella multidivaricata]|uniref:uncharacterized protein n=1 Tax=Gamsiella multidivaricata TaxID=101098 RepID=UPI00221EC634|nr:uncharacterized protein BC939DRAFT_442441 [Gamsiella multidivaricata]KAI7828987.1 hypothetical protein BC939DRAFT_442441 [Gamsiella multidivaricata]